MATYRVILNDEVLSKCEEILANPGKRKKRRKSFSFDIPSDFGSRRIKRIIITLEVEAALAVQEQT